MASLSILLTVGLAFGAAASVSFAWRSRAARLTALGVGAFAFHVLALQILGVLAAATGAPLVRAPGLLVVAGVLCALAWSVRRWAARGSAEAGSAVSPGPAIEGAPAGNRRDARRAYVGGGTIAAAAAVAGGFLACAVISGLSAPPRGWDILAYHLPRTVSWLLHGDLGAYGSTGAFYPGNAGLALLSLLFTGSDRLVPIVQLPFALLSGVAVFGLSRELGAAARSAALATLVLLLSPIVFFHSTVAKDDLVVTAMVVAGALFLVRSLRNGLDERGRLREVAAAGIALGLALGTKYSILPYVVASVPLLFVLHALRVEPSAEAPRARCAARSLGVYVLAVAVPSAFWFVRNAVATGNPVAPLSIGIGEWIVSAGVDKELQFVGSPALWWLFPWSDRQLVAGYSGAAGFGAAFAVLFVPGLAISAVAAVSRRLGREVRLKLSALLLSVVIGVAGWWFAKYHLPRLLLPVVGLACAPVALVFDAVTHRARAALVVILACALGFSAAETLRVVFNGSDITWAHQGGVDRREFYRMPDLVYELPVGTRVLLLKPSADDVHQTYRYPLAGNLPGNDVVMEDDVGAEMALADRGAVLGHLDLHRRGVDYVFMRVHTMSPRATVFDAYPSLYEEVVDTVEPGYRWYRDAYLVDAAGDILGRALVITKMYRVLPRPSGLGEEAAGPGS